MPCFALLHSEMSHTVWGVGAAQVVDADGAALCTATCGDLRATSARVARALVGGGGGAPAIGPEDVCLIVCYDGAALAVAAEAAGAGVWPLASPGCYLLALQLGVLRSGAAFMLVPDALLSADGGCSPEGIARLARQVHASCVLVLEKDMSAVEREVAKGRGSLPSGFRVLSAQDALLRVDGESSCGELATVIGEVRPFHPCWFVKGTRLQACEHRNAVTLLDHRLRHHQLTQLYAGGAGRALFWGFGEMGGALAEQQTMEVYTSLTAGGTLIFVANLHSTLPLSSRLVAAARVHVLAAPAACVEGCLHALSLERAVHASWPSSSEPSQPWRLPSIPSSHNTGTATVTEPSQPSELSRGAPAALLPPHLRALILCLADPGDAEEAAGGQEAAGAASCGDTLEECIEYWEGRARHLACDVRAGAGAGADGGGMVVHVIAGQISSNYSCSAVDDVSACVCVCG